MSQSDRRWTPEQTVRRRGITVLDPFHTAKAAGDTASALGNAFGAENGGSVRIACFVLTAGRKGLIGSLELL